MRDGPTAAFRVLIVDDHVDAAESLGLLVRWAGFEVRVAHDGPSALDVADAFRPSVALLDLSMPGMDGYEVARRLRERSDGAGLRLIAVTGSNERQDRERVRAAGFAHHVVKPVEIERLTSLLRSDPTPRGGHSFA